MADLSINMLPVSDGLTDDSLLVVYQNNKTQSIQGQLIKQFARASVEEYVSAAQDAAEQAEQAAKDAQAAADSVAYVTEKAEEAAQAALAAQQAKEAAETARQAAEQAAALAAQQAAQDVESALLEYLTQAEQARDDAQSAAQTAANETAAAVEADMKGYVSEAQAAKAAAEQAKNAAQNAAETAAQGAVAEVEAEMTGYVSAAEAAKAAAEKARDDAQSIAGGDFASTAYVDSKASAAESNANAYADQKIAAIPTPDVSGQIGEHNTNAESHNDIRELIIGLTNRLNTLADSDDTTLDQLSEVVAYIKNNKSLIDGITTSKVNVADIINNLTTNVSNKPLSAAQGVALKALIDAITVPTKVSELENDSGYLTSYTETDPTVPTWAKATSKPSYTAGEVGAYTKDQTNTLLQNYLPISGGTLTGNLTGKYITGTWLQATDSNNHLTSTAAKVAVLDASGWVYYRTIAELLADLGIPDATTIQATTSVYGTTKLSTSVTSTSKTLAATPYAVKTALDQAKAYTNSAIGDAIAASY